jgi:hypothetical protein
VRVDLLCGIAGTGISQRGTLRVYSDGGGLCTLNGGQFDYQEYPGSSVAGRPPQVGEYTVNSCNPIDVDLYCYGGIHKIHE